MWLRNKKTGGLFNTDDIKGKYMNKLNDISKREYENKIDKTEYDKEVRKATEDYKREKAYKDYVKRTLNNDEYLQANRPNEYFQKQLRESGVKTFADEIKEDNKYKVDVSKRVKENKIVDSFGNNVVYQNKTGNWITSRENYNDYVTGKAERLGGTLALNEKDARETLASYDALEKYPYKGYVADMKLGNDVKYKEQKQANLDKMYKTIGYDDSKYNYGFKKEEFHFAGEELYSDDPNRFGDKMRKYNEKMNPTKEDDISPMSEYSDTTGTGLSDKQHTALTNMSLSKMQSMAREYGVETKGLTKKQLMAKLITIFNK